ncbi:MAG TPA: non-heme iron oxygenase ferredoxin subunit [Anaerolineae bacterium]|nr:non-heme iron oxygenase ferredoxin subunit [Anaerolineae bacterium]
MSDKQFAVVGKVDDLPAGERLWHEFEYETIVVFNIDGSYYAIDDICTHDNGPLADGPVVDMCVMCPRHGAKFDLRTGAATFPAVKPVKTYEVRLENGNILVEVPE